MGFWDMKHALEWQLEMGADEAIGDTPIDRYAVAPEPKKKAVAPTIDEPQKIDAVAIASAAAEAATSLEALREAMEQFEHCGLKRGAKQLVFSDGQAKTRVMIVGEAPGRDEDLQGKPFVGRAGQLLDLMFSHIGLARTSPDPAHALYITNVLPWRPPQNRDPKPEEVAMMLPFLKRHIELVDPDVLVAMGNHACQALLGRQGITRMRGNWMESKGKPLLPMFHPAYLLRNPIAKREAWADLLEVKARLSHHD
ncbi:MAG: uracil-DNA glycosylase [Boseongicola sp.]|nr:uracil-DNA glycosylase [Boseongicola sp.]